MNADSPDLSLFRLHLEEAPFLNGAEAGHWGLVDGERLELWPLCRIWVRSATRFCAEGRVVLRFNLDNYPASAPTAQPWNVTANLPLDKDQWPKGAPQIESVFKPGWKTTALYMPCDRVAMDGHDQWKQTFPEWWWTSKHTIADYLTFVFQRLNPACDD